MSYKKILIIAALLFGLTGLLAYAPHASALFNDATGEACQGVGLGSSGCDSGTGGLSNLIKVSLETLSIVIGIAAVVMLMIGGFKYITSGGESSKVTSAKNTIIYALIGLVVVVMAQVIVKFVVNTSTTTPKAKTSTTP